MFVSALSQKHAPNRQNVTLSMADAHFPIINEILTDSAALVAVSDGLHRFSKKLQLKNAKGIVCI